MSDLTDALRTLLADTVALYYRAQGHHWNVEGADFAEFHDFFGKIYDDLGDSIDPIAENLRKLGEYAPFRLERFVELKTLPEAARTSTDCRGLATDLLEGVDYMVGRLKDAFRVATQADEQGIADFLAGRIDIMQKWAWQLRATLK